MQATRTTLGSFPLAVSLSANARMTGLCWRAERTAMYKTLLTELRPPWIIRRPRNCPLSRLKGAIPTNAEIFSRLSFP